MVNLISVDSRLEDAPSGITIGSGLWLATAASVLWVALAGAGLAIALRNQSRSPGLREGRGERSARLPWWAPTAAAALVVGGVALVVLTSDRMYAGGSRADSGPTIDSFSAQEEGGVIRLTARYCDATPGTSELAYHFYVTAVWRHSVFRSQTEICENAEVRLSVRYPKYRPGSYRAKVTVRNLTTGKTTDATSVPFVVG